MTGRQDSNPGPAESAQSAQSARPYDVVLFGATGFAGGLTADYLVEHLPSSGRMALAGRNRDKLEAVRDRLTGINPDVSEIGLLHADSTDPGSLAEVARSAKVVITTVGPYLEYGAGIVAACAAEGTDYVDLTGEPEFVDRMFVKNDATARKTGARIVHACGFDSIPHDLGALYTARLLPGDVPIEMRGVVRTNATMSGGTLHSALNQFSRLRPLKEASSQRYEIETRPTDRRAKLKTERPRRDPVTENWLIPLPTIDGQIVKRSARTAPDIEDFGPEFTYSHNAGAKKFLTVPASIIGFPLLIAAVQIPPVRRAIAKRIAAGDGPSQERRDQTWFTVDFVATAADKTVHTRVSGGDPGYTETAKMLAESALCLAFDHNPELAGQLTTATAMGQNLIDRLTAAGLTFEVLS